MTVARRIATTLGDVAWRRSPQRVDPLGTLGVRAVSLIGVVAAIAYAVLQTSWQWSQVVNPGFAVSAVVLLAVACVVFLAAARPAAAPFGPTAEGIVLVLAAAAAALEVAGRLGRNLLLQDDFGQVAVGILLLSMAPYRSARSLVAGTVAVSTVCGLLAIPQQAGLSVHAPLAEYMVVLVVPPLALGLAASAYAYGFVRRVAEWQRAVARAALDAEEEASTGIARSVQQDQVTVLSRDVLPFLARVLSASEVTADDVARAGTLAGAVRGTLVAEIGRSWLDDVAESVRLPGGGHPRITDPYDLAGRMSEEQRVACAAVVAAIAESEVIGAESVRVDLAVRSGAPTTTIVAVSGTALDRRRVQRALLQYLAVARVLFPAVAVRVAAERVTVEFQHGEA